MEARLHTWFDERCVEPRFQQIVLPSLWPRKKNTRGGEEEEDGVEGKDTGAGRRAEDGGRVEGEGIRLRRREMGQEGLKIPGAMPGMTVS